MDALFLSEKFLRNHIFPYLQLQLHMLQGILESDADQLVSGTVGSGGKLIVFILKRFIDPDRHGDGFIFFWRDDEFIHSDSVSLHSLTTILLYLLDLKKSITR